MPKLTIITLRIGLLNFAVGWTLGAWLLATRGAPHIHPSFDLLHPHISLITLGAMLQIVLSVAYWILPRQGRERPRAWLAVLAFACLNFSAWVGMNVFWTLPSVALAVVSALLFLAHAVPRIRPFGAVIKKSEV